jgi:hypothetical protein
LNWIPSLLGRSCCFDSKFSDVVQLRVICPQVNWSRKSHSSAVGVVE